MRKMTKVWFVVSVVSALGANAQAGQSVTPELDKCIKQKQFAYTAKGALVGALTGYLGARATGKDAEKGALIGAAAGGAFGFVTAWNKAVGACKLEHPNWVLESDIMRSPNYDAVVAEFNYMPPQKDDIAVVRQLQMPEQVTPDSTASIPVKFVVLTPDGGEAKVKIDRKIFIIDDDKEVPLSWPGRDSEDRVVENGEQEENVSLYIPKEIPVGTKLRFQYAISLNDAPIVSQSGIVEVK